MIPPSIVNVPVGSRQKLSFSPPISFEGIQSCENLVVLLLDLNGCRNSLNSYKTDRYTRKPPINTTCIPGFG